jgi:hypothetical protein
MRFKRERSTRVLNVLCGPKDKDYLCPVQVQGITSDAPIVRHRREWRSLMVISGAKTGFLLVLDEPCAPGDENENAGVSAGEWNQVVE